FSVERGLGDLETAQFNPEKFDDKWYQAALAVEGKVANFDVTYAGSYMQRQIDGQLDYSDYAYFYDKIADYGTFFYDNAGALVNPNQYIQSDDSFTKMSHELRFTSPAEKRVRLVGGLFYQRQTHNIEQDYIIDNIADAITVPGTDSNIWLTKQLRTDRDYAAFGEVSFDITPQLTATAGGRLYRYDNTLVGFFGYSDGFSSRTGVAACFADAKVDGSPCTNVDKTTKDNGFIHRLNLTYKPNKDYLFYGTWSRGFRPGGINRRGNLPPYAPDFITNYEAGMKLSFMNDRLRFNAAAYRLDWDDIQLSFLGANGLTEIRNAGMARIYGAEFDLYVRPATGLTFNAGLAYNNAKLKNDFCQTATFDCSGEELAFSGTRLPLTARIKGNVRTRYEWALGAHRAHAQLTASYEGERRRDLRDAENDVYGNLARYAQLDASTGLRFGRWKSELFVKNILDKRGEISKSVQCNELICGDANGDTAIGGKVYTTVIRPRTIGLRFGRTF
ncbi:MAG: TonB-dependent receptor, partial [Pseudomonadota bacterium]|nr:TonB-dependent receptor [Pseudomonadota bacterium]